MVISKQNRIETVSGIAVFAINLATLLFVVWVAFMSWREHKSLQLPELQSIETPDNPDSYLPSPDEWQSNPAAAKQDNVWVQENYERLK